MSDFFAELREQVRKAMADDAGPLARLLREATEGDRTATPLERALVAVTGLSAAAVGVGLAATSMLGLALAAVILYVVLTRVFGFDLRLDPATLFAGMWPPGAKPGER
jgi:anti-sigma factor RsiW